jgi:uncharacterized protein (DUF1697 family)
MVRLKNPIPARRDSRSNKVGTYVALLRGINVGGKNKVPMPDLVEMFTEAGCSNVRTYIQSGNVVFSVAPKSAKRVPDLVSRRIADRFGYRVPVVLRTVDEFRQVAVSNPFLQSDCDANSLHVGFLADLPDPRDVAALDPKRSPGDSFTMRGQEIYLCLPNGVARTKLTNAYFDSRLTTTSTFRNWRTVLKLLELTQPTA